MRRKYSAGTGTSRFIAIKGAGIATGFHPKLRDKAAGILHASLAKGTWDKYSSGWRAFEDFQRYTNTVHTWPLAGTVVASFATYLLTVKGLMVSSTRSYISAISALQRLKGHKTVEWDDPLLSSIIRGATNLDMGARPLDRRVMTVPLLRHTGHRLATSGWGQVAI